MTHKKLVVMTVIGLVLALALGTQALLAESTADAALIRLQTFTFDPLAGEPELGPSLRAAASAAGPATYLVQFRGPVEETWKVAVEQAGARLYGYVPDFAFVARMDAAAVRVVQALPTVRWVGLYQPAYRLAPDLLRVQAAAAGTETLSVLTLPDADLDALAAQVEALGGAVLGRAANAFDGLLRVTLPAGQALTLARADGVLWVEPYLAPALHNDVGGGGIMRAAAVRQSLGLYGAGQIVAVADSGLDRGDVNNMHPDFRGRVVQAYCLGRPDPCNWSDADGHGTHVAGSVLGSGAASGSNPAAHQYAGSYAGVAPEARVVFQSLDDNDGQLGGIPDDRGDLMRQAHGDGARIHTNSWGGPTGNINGVLQYGGYTVGSQTVDAAAWELKDILILYSAGNNGVDANRNGVIDPDSLGAPGTAKNVLTVGASENARPSITRRWGDMRPADWGADPIAGDFAADNTNGMAAFSSRGPADDGRIKPDVTAPGTYILSTRSQHPNAGDGWGAFNQYYLYMGGTSMSTPLTAGAAAVVREWLVRRGGVANPSAALMKALLINGAADISPGQYGAGAQQETPSQRPNIVNGWGRVDLVESLAPGGGRQVWVQDETAGIGTNGSRTYQLTVGGGLAGAAGLSPATAVVLAPAAPTANLIQNGGFEANAAWTPVDMDYTSDAAHSGSRSMASFPGVDGYVYQLVQVPANATAATLSYWWRNEEGDVGFDQLQAAIYTADLAQVIGAGPQHSAEDAAWHSQSLNLAPLLDDLRGETVAVVFEVTQDSAAPDAGFFIDDVVLDVQTGGGATPTPTATPTRPPGATPTPTATPTRPPGGAGALRITLAWTDYPGQPAAAKTLVNDLDLEVIAPDGTRYRGNAGVYTGGQCLRGGQWDACNNVEGIIIPNATNGGYQVIVRGANVPQGLQPFALAASGVGLRQGGAQPTATPTRPSVGQRSLYLPLVVR